MEESEKTESRRQAPYSACAEGISQEDFYKLNFISEKWLRRQLTKPEQDRMVRIYGMLQKNMDLVDLLLEHCTANRHESTYYIEGMAKLWVANEIRTVSQAKQWITGIAPAHKDEYGTVIKAFYDSARMPNKTESEYIDRWMDEYNLPTEVILKACELTKRQTGKPLFSYTDAILKSWSRNGVRTIDDINELDWIHEEAIRKENSRRSAPKAANPPETSEDNAAFLSEGTLKLTKEELSFVRMFRNAGAETKAFIRHMMQYIELKETELKQEENTEPEQQLQDKKKANRKITR